MKMISVPSPLWHVARVATNTTLVLSRGCRLLCSCVSAWPLPSLANPAPFLLMTESVLSLTTAVCSIFPTW